MLSCQTFIDKFRYNAKRASLVQSRIKVLVIISVTITNQMLKKFHSHALHTHPLQSQTNIFISCFLHIVKLLYGLVIFKFLFKLLNFIFSVIKVLFFPSTIFQALERMGHVDEIVNDPEYELLFFCCSISLNIFICLFSSIINYVLSGAI